MRVFLVFVLVLVGWGLVGCRGESSGDVGTADEEVVVSGGSGDVVGRSWGLPGAVFFENASARRGMVVTYGLGSGGGELVVTDISALPERGFLGVAMGDESQLAVSGVGEDGGLRVWVYRSVYEPVLEWEGIDGRGSDGEVAYSRNGGTLILKRAAGVSTFVAREGRRLWVEDWAGEGVQTSFVGGSERRQIYVSGFEGGGFVWDPVGRYQVMRVEDGLERLFFREGRIWGFRGRDVVQVRDGSARSSVPELGDRSSDVSVSEGAEYAVWRSEDKSGLGVLDLQSGVFLGWRALGEERLVGQGWTVWGGALVIPDAGHLVVQAADGSGVRYRFWPCWRWDPEGRSSWYLESSEGGWAGSDAAAAFRGRDAGLEDRGLVDGFARLVGLL